MRRAPMKGLMQARVDDILGALAWLCTVLERILDFVLRNRFDGRIQLHALFWRQRSLDALQGQEIALRATQVNGRFSLAPNKRADKRGECTG